MPNAKPGFKTNGYVHPASDAVIPVLQQISDMELPPQVNLTPHCSPVENQGDIGSCTANAVVGALEYFQIATGHKMVDLSRLFVYYNARRLSDRELVDAGTSMPHVMASILAYGVCAEATWPYDAARWNMKPAEDCYRATMQFPDFHYARVSPGQECKYVLATGLPIIFGMGVPEYLMKKYAWEYGYMPAPENGQWESADGGGHAMLIVGYDDDRNAWLVRNSWGREFGIEGHMWVDYRVMDHYGFPGGFWTLGPLDHNRMFRVQGPTQQMAQAQTLAAAPAGIQQEIISMRRGIRHTLDGHLTETRKGLRDRLRGPGVGDGYDKGPGVGGGYDKGPGVGGGYDKGPGAGGGYDD